MDRGLQGRGRELMMTGIVGGNGLSARDGRPTLIFTLE